MKFFRQSNNKLSQLDFSQLIAELKKKKKVYKKYSELGLQVTIRAEKEQLRNDAIGRGVCPFVPYKLTYHVHC